MLLLLNTVLCAIAGFTPAPQDVAPTADAATEVAPEESSEVANEVSEEAPAEAPEEAPAQAISAPSSDEAPESAESEPEPEQESPGLAPKVAPDLAPEGPDEDDDEEVFSGSQRDDAEADSGPGEESGGEKKKKKKLEVKVRARVVAGIGARNEASPVDDEGAPVGLPIRDFLLELRQARARVDVKYKKVLRVRISADFADLLGSPDPGEVIRDGWGNIKILPEFQIKVGNFKRPYSRLELRGVSKLPFIGRGMFNSLAIEDLGWGDRATGMALWGKHEPEKRGLHELGWAVSLSNNVIAGAPAGVDVHARLTYDPLEWMSIGVNGAFKYVEDSLADGVACQSEWIRADGCRREVFAGGFDLEFKTDRLYASTELNLAQDWLFADTSPWMLSALGYVSYDFVLGKRERTRLQPMVLGEYIDHNLDFALSEAIRGVVGLNVLWTKYLRILPQVQVEWPLSPWTSFNRLTRRWRAGVWVSVQL